jgi:hypothetical protein
LSLELGDEFARAGEADIHEVAPGESAVLERDSTDDVRSWRWNLPKHGVGRTVDAVVFENRFEWENDRWTLDVAAFEGLILDNAFVPASRAIRMTSPS